MITPDARPRISNLFRMQFEPAQDGWVLLYPEGMVRLNAPAAEILRRCDGRRTVDEIVAELELAFAQTPLHDDVVVFLSQALQSGWLHSGHA
ncbi:MAG: pyrroloquinoline quinone biosynthesis peptide chaperone PqqD [Variovorax sp.]